MSATHGPLVAIGIGNILLGDDGVGVRVVEALREPAEALREPAEALREPAEALREPAEADPGALPPETRLVDGGTLGLDLLRYLDGARGLLIVDADLGAPAGTVTARRDAHATGGWAGRAARGGGRGVEELLAVAAMLGVLPAAVSVVGIGVGEIGPGRALSARVAAAMPRAVVAARRELAALDARAAAAGSARRAHPGLPTGATA